MVPEKNVVMRITFVSNTGYSLFHREVQETYGGAQVDLYLLAKEFSKNTNYEVSIIYLDYGQALVEQVGRIRLHKSYKPRRKGSPLFFQFAIACFKLWGALSRANASVYFHEGAEFEIAITRIFCFVKRRKYILRLASIGDVDSRYRRANPVHSRLFNFGLFGASAVVAQTHDQARLLVSLKKPVSIIDNVFPYQNRQPDEHKNIIWVGRLIKMKRAEIFLRLAKTFPRDHFVLLGPVDAIDQGYARTIQRATRNIDNLKYIEKVPFHNVSEVFAKAYLLINTSEYEGFPMTFVQAMSAGVPILTLGIDPDNVVSKYAGYVARDENEMQKMYVQMFQPKIWSLFSQSGQKYAKDNFSSSVVIPKYQKILDSIAP